MNIQSAAINVLRATDASSKKLDELQTATQSFEAMFLKKMLSTMHSDKSEALFGKSPGSDTFKDMFDDAISNASAKRSQVGIGKVLFNSTSTRVVGEALQHQSTFSNDKDSKKI